MSSAPAPLLYTHRRCPYVMRARMALLQAGVAFDAFEIGLRDKPAGLLALLAACDGPFKRPLDRTKYPERYGDGTERGQQRGPQLGGRAPCATDIAVWPFVRQFAALDTAWFEALPLPALHAWWRGWLSHPLFLAAMPQLPVGEVVAFPVP